jgi:hypothetical protein
MLNLRAWLARRAPAAPRAGADISPLADPPMDDLPAPLTDIGRGAGDAWPGWRYLGSNGPAPRCGRTGAFSTDSGRTWYTGDD